MEEMVRERLILGMVKSETYRGFVVKRKRKKEAAARKGQTTE